MIAPTPTANLIPRSLSCILLMLVACLTSRAHTTDETYIWLNPQADHFDGQIQIRLPDLREYLELDIPEDFEEAKSALQDLGPILEGYVTAHFKLNQLDGTPIPYSIVQMDLLELEPLGHFVMLIFRTPTMTVPSQIKVRSTLFFEHDRFTRSLLCMSYNHFTGESFPEVFHHELFSPRAPEAEVDFNQAFHVSSTYSHYIKEGVRHIWIGIDHVLFLIALLLPAVYRKRSRASSTAYSESPAVESTEWSTVESFRQGLWNIVKIVTIFTIAHSITLYLSALDIFTLPAQLVESVIALSIVMIAAGNVFPVLRHHNWIVLFIFGLFHGMGFASVLQELPFRMQNLPRLLVCFNGGVELGQISIVAVIFPILFGLRNKKFYRPLILQGGSLIIGLFAAYWLYERTFAWSS